MRKADETNTHRTQGRENVPSGLARIREVAKKDKELQFTALLHHVTVDRLHEAYLSLNRSAQAGVDNQTWEDYGAGLQERLDDLKDRIHRGAYRAKPSRRVYIAKTDGGRRPLGIPALEDKIVQTAVVGVINTIYEADFLGFSYGFRAQRGPHQALDALAYGITRRKVNWVLDADIRAYFDTIDHEWLMRFLEHRIGDKRILRLIRKWLNAGVLEEAQVRTASRGTPQGATISPLLANVFLHYVFDLWAHAWRNSCARGDVVIVRFADDFVVGFQHRGEAENFLRALKERLSQYGLELHPKKTRLIEFGRFARKGRQANGKSKPKTFDFLGFTHICGVTKSGQFLLRRHTIKKRLRMKIKDIRQKLYRRMHWSLPDLGQWLHSVIVGYDGYHAVPTNRHNLRIFRWEISKACLAAFRRRSDKDRTTWAWLSRRLDFWIPPFQYRHPWPDQRFMRDRLIRGAV